MEERRHFGGAAATDKPPLVVSPDEAARLHPGEWILMRVTAFDQDRLPSQGEVVAHGPSHKRICRKLSTLLASPGYRETPLYVFAGRPRLRTGAELRRLLEQAKHEDHGDPWRWPRW